jgi:hypothetical protein
VLPTVPLTEPPPETPSQVKVPESIAPVCVIVITTGQPSMCWPAVFVQASLTHIPEASATEGLVGVEQPDSTANAAQNNPSFLIGANFIQAAFFDSEFLIGYDGSIIVVVRFINPSRPTSTR